MEESAVEISAKMQIWSEFLVFRTMTFDNDDSPIQKRKSLNIGYFDAPFLSKNALFMSDYGISDCDVFLPFDRGFLS
jgi:hypothetical protein